MASRFLATAAAFTVLAAFATGCSSTKECSLVACESAATIRMRAAMPAADLSQATISACRTEPGGQPACSTGKIAIVPTLPNDRLQFSMSGTVDVRAFVSSPDPTKGYLLEFIYNLEGATTQNGDTYEVKVLLNNNPAAGVNEAATYQIAQPNGPDCPPVCRTTVIDKS